MGQPANWQPKALIHGRSIGAYHARPARRWVSRVGRCLREMLSAVLIALAQTLRQSGIAKYPGSTAVANQP